MGDLNPYGLYTHTYNHVFVKRRGGHKRVKSYLTTTKNLPSKTVISA
jgi:hypothetical protein